MNVRHHLVWGLALVQALAGVRLGWRMLRTAGGTRIVPSETPVGEDRVTVVVPVLNEARRLAPCLEGLMRQPPEVDEILIVDGGSSDGTSELVARYAARDCRIRWLDASPVPPDWNGKAYGLQVGFAHSPATTWLLTVDADVRPGAGLIPSLVAHARRTRAPIVSVATRQVLTGRLDALLHPALLTTLVYRFGIPGQATLRAGDIQANGQCCLFWRKALDEIGGFQIAQRSRCEDVTVARALAVAGYAVGFYEADELVSVAMYENWRELWRNWPRSLPMLDQFSGGGGWLRLVEIGLTQALPLPGSILLSFTGRSRQLVGLVNLCLLVVRLGVLAGTARAYVRRPWIYWLSPLADFPATVALWRSALWKHHQWRGRPLPEGMI